MHFSFAAIAMGRNLFVESFVGFRQTKQFHTPLSVVGWTSIELFIYYLLLKVTLRGLYATSQTGIFANTSVTNEE